MERFKSRSVGNVSYVLLLVVLICVGVYRISLTYNVFWQTFDEPFHIAAGMEWLAEGQYTYEHFHPPLARVMVALGPYLNGTRDVKNAPGEPWSKGNALLHAGGEYEHNLTSARIGILPFFVVACLVVALWGKHISGKGTSLIALALFTTLPAILAHSGQAALDMACAALVTAALFNFIIWLNKPTFWCTVGLGITVGLAVLSKMTALGFLVVSGGSIFAAYALYCFREKPEARNQSTPTLKVRLAASAAALFLCALTIWAGYRFSIASLTATVDDEIATYAYQAIDSRLGTSGSLHDMAMSLLETPVPAPEFFVGIFRALHRASNGHLNQFFGEIRTQGWWYFYPVVLAIKTPLPTLILSVAGVFFIFKNLAPRNQNWFQLLAPLLVFVSILLVAVLSNVNNGIRTILAIYGPLTVIAGYGAARILSFDKNNKIRFGVLIVTTILLWQSISSFRAHPDYLAYFNQLVGNHPEQVVNDSDLDWGQDVKRLAVALHDYDINYIKLNLNGVLDIDKLDFPPNGKLKPYTRETGWIAISIYRLTFGTREPPYDQFSWLREHQPVKEIGTTIRLYYIDPNSVTVE